MKTGFATAAIEIANSIEAHLTGAVATISQRNQGISNDVGQAVFAGGVPHREINSAGQIIFASGAGVSIFHVFDFLNFKAKAFRFCLFFYHTAAGRNVAGVETGKSVAKDATKVIPCTINSNVDARFPIEWGMTMQKRKVRWAARLCEKFSKQIFN